jgi:GntR family transcriptional regulator, negative regulator for fad regulon and positive regulator of fabA
MPIAPERKPADRAEQLIIHNILTGTFPHNSNLPAERQLAGTLGVTRPTLREVLQRLGRDGWLEIHHGKPTRVRDYMTEGSLSLLPEVTGSGTVDPALVSSLLDLRLLIAPSYTRMAVETRPADVYMMIQSLADLPDDAAGTALFDWRVHYGLAVLSGNPIFALILKDLEGFSETMLAEVYARLDIRQTVRTAYRMIGKAARAGEPDAAEALMRRVLQESSSGFIGTTGLTS